MVISVLLSFRKYFRTVSPLRGWICTRWDPWETPYTLTLYLSASLCSDPPHSFRLHVRWNLQKFGFLWSFLSALRFLPSFSQLRSPMLWAAPLLPWESSSYPLTIYRRTRRFLRALGTSSLRARVATFRACGWGFKCEAQWDQWRLLVACRVLPLTRFRSEPWTNRWRIQAAGWSPQKRQ